MLASLAAIFLAGLVASACGDDEDTTPSTATASASAAAPTNAVPASPSPSSVKSGAITISGAWARTTGEVGAVYFTISNAGQADRLLRASVDPTVAREAQLHTMVTEGTTSRMQQVEAIDVRAGADTVLQPGGFHVMLMNVVNMKVGDTLRVGLTFEKAGTITVEAPVQPYTPAAGMTGGMTPGAGMTPSSTASPAGGMSGH